MRENLKALCRNGILNDKILKEACNLIDITLTDEQIEYIIMKLFERSDNVHKLSIDHLFEIFSTKPQPRIIEQPKHTTESVPTIRINTEPKSPVKEEHKSPIDARHKEFVANNFIKEAHHDEEEFSPVKQRYNAHELEKSQNTNEEEEQEEEEQGEENENYAEGEEEEGDEYEGEEHEKYQSEELKSNDYAGEVRSLSK